jgi:manganese/zinc/iron transport system ATP- binding protein
MNQPSDPSYAVDVEDLYVNYGKNPVLWDVSFRLPKGALVGIIGPNGAGKSTLLKAMLHLVLPVSGKIDLLGTSDFSQAQQKIAYVPQRGSVDWDFPITAFEVVLMGRYGKLKFFQRPRKADKEAAFAALEKVGMVDFADRQIGQLSGGQQQRLFIARAIVQSGELLLLDEPFAGVDLTTEKSMIDLLKKEKESNKTVLVVHHDLPTVEEYFDWVILLNTRLVAYGPTASVFTKENLNLTFGKHQTLFDEAASLSAKSLSGIL